MNAEPSLFQGFVQVEQFGDDQVYEQIDGEVIEEVEYVTLDLGSVEPTLVPSTSSYRLIGLDTPTPFLQLSGTVFKGEHQSLLGTELLFTDSKDDQAERNKKGLAYVANTERRIRFREVELKPKNQSNLAFIAEISPSTVVATSSKKKITGTVEELVGNETGSAPRGRGRRGRGKSTKGKGRAQTAQPEDEAMEITED
ncbi:hypothetical protein BC629DRAFT_1487838 [Irpex lacteus]|nr:hypothetical protein BC629DRAFT_1487838 [Irpex lacteus]